MITNHVIFLLTVSPDQVKSHTPAVIVRYLRYFKTCGYVTDSRVAVRGWNDHSTRMIEPCPLEANRDNRVLPFCGKTHIDRALLVGG